MIFLDYLSDLNIHSNFFLSFIILSFLILSSECLLYSNNLIFNAHGQQTEKDPAFQDSYWTDKTIASGNNSDKLEEREVGPSEGIATLAVVLVNKAQSEITSIKGYLSLPSDFQAVKTRNVDLPNSTFTFNSTGRSNLTANITTNGVFSTSSASPNLPNIAVASYDSIIQPGEEFTFYFDINVMNNADIGLYEASLDLVYSKVLTAGDVAVEDIVVPFRVPGKVILDVKSNDQYLSPGQLNRVNIDVINKGSADANSAIITISNTDDNSQGSLTTVSPSAEDIELRDDDANNRNNNNTTNNNSSSTNIVENEDNNTTSNSLTTIGTQRFSIGTIPAGEIISIPSVLYPAITASEGLQNLNVEVSYGNPLGNRETIDFSLGFVISAQPTESNFDVYLRSDNHHNDDNTNIKTETNSSSNVNSEPDTNTITAGKIQDIAFTIEKTTPSEINDVIISISPSSDSVKLLGSSRWSFETLTAKTINVNTDVFASEDLIGNPVQFNVDIQYILNGLSKSETLGLGMYIDGNITISAFDFELNTIGDEPNLVANLLNEGNMDALFTTVEMIPPPFQSQENNEGNLIATHFLQEYPPLQYVGDLAENSPLPISIPLNIPNGTQAGEYPVFIKVSYKDNLRNTHEIIVEGNVDYTPTIDQSPSENGLLSNVGNNPLILVVTVLVFSIVIFLIIRSVKKKRKMQKIRSISADENSNSDLDSLLEK